MPLGIINISKYHKTIDVSPKVNKHGIGLINVRSLHDIPNIKKEFFI